ncbi:MAG TPA: hypothetical protein VFD67_11445, partial [Gemmatimonadaceae bacterium]|nr:hypothetical protein [Gemmatimonadaceae bacterium]
NSDIWRMPRAGGESVQITTDVADEFMPEQSPDGAWLAYYSLRHGSRDIFVRPTGHGDPVRVTSDPEEETQPHWSPDGTKLCYGQLSTRASQYSIRTVRRLEGGWSTPVTLPGAGGRSNRFFGCVGWLPGGRELVVHDAERTMIAIMPDEGGAARVIYRQDPARGLPQPIWIRLEPRTGTIFFRDWQSIWLIDPKSLVPRQIVRFNDPTRHSTRIEMESDGERVYFTLGDPQSELNTARLSGPSTRRN